MAPAVGVVKVLVLLKLKQYRLALVIADEADVIPKVTDKPDTVVAVVMFGYGVWPESRLEVLTVQLAAFVITP